MSIDLNHTHICLVPKTKTLIKIGEYRLLSLGNMIIKITTKILANRLKQILSDIIDESRCAFVLDRLITDNILIAFEFFHFMKTYSPLCHNYMYLKLEMAKAYNHAEWGFLRVMMLR